MNNKCIQERAVYTDSAMGYFEAVILGAVQGLTEFIPVSSSGHLILADEIGQLGSSFAFDVVLNLGTLLALVFFYRAKLTELYRGVVYGRNMRLARNIIISTLPAVFVGGLFADFFADNARDPSVVVVMLLLVGVLMLWADSMRGSKQMNDIQPVNALLIGIGQALALIPGTSRSGATILAGKFNRLTYGAAADYSFLIAIPIVAGAIVRSLFETETIDLLNQHTGVVIVGVAASAISGWLAIRFMLTFLKTRGLKIFGIYRIILALAIVLFVN